VHHAIRWFTAVPIESAGRQSIVGAPAKRPKSPLSPGAATIAHAIRKSILAHLGEVLADSCANTELSIPVLCRRAISGSAPEPDVGGAFLTLHPYRTGHASTLLRTKIPRTQTGPACPKSGYMNLPVPRRGLLSAPRTELRGEMRMNSRCAAPSAPRCLVEPGRAATAR